MSGPDWAQGSCIKPMSINVCLIRDANIIIYTFCMLRYILKDFIFGTSLEKIVRI